VLLFSFFFYIFCLRLSHGFVVSKNVVSNEDDAIAKLVQCAQDGKSVVIVPTISNFRSVDVFAVCPISDERKRPLVTMFQTTVSDKHSYSPSTLMKFVESVGENCDVRFCVVTTKENIEGGEFTLNYQPPSGRVVPQKTKNAKKSGKERAYSG